MTLEQIRAQYELVEKGTLEANLIAGLRAAYYENVDEYLQLLEKAEELKRDIWAAVKRGREQRWKKAGA